MTGTTSCPGVYGPFEPVPIGEGNTDDEPPGEEPLRGWRCGFVEAGARDGEEVKS